MRRDHPSEAAVASLRIVDAGAAIRTRLAGGWTRHVPNGITFGRLGVLAPVVVVLAVAGVSDAVIGLVVIAGGVSDFVDGQLARRLGATSELGRILDPVADRVFGLSVYVAAFVSDVVPPVVVLALFVRDLMAAAGSALLGPSRVADLRVRPTGKAATALIYMGMTVAFLGEPAGRGVAVAVLVPAAALYYLSLGQYFADAVTGPSHRTRSMR